MSTSRQRAATRPAPGGGAIRAEPRPEGLTAEHTGRGEMPLAHEGREEMPRAHVTRRNLLVFVLFVASAIAFLYFVVPKLAGLQETYERVRRGNPWWIGAALAFEVLSFGSYVAVFRTVLVRGQSRIDWRESYQITMAGLAATRLFAAAGAGGVALTAWALRRSGMERRIVACRMVAFMVLLYGVYMATLVLGGVGLRTGLLPGPAPFGFTVVPAVFGATVIVVVLAMTLVPADLERRLKRTASGSSRLARWAARLASVPAAAASGVRTAISITREGHWGVLGAVGWWFFDIATLWASFKAFGSAPTFSVVVMGYFVGMLANTLPLPGGIGGVDGGMIGAFLAFGVDPALAVVAVLVYRGFAFWLPTLPGALAYLQLRRTVSRWEAELQAQPAAA